MLDLITKLETLPYQIAGGLLITAIVVGSCQIRDESLRQQGAQRLTQQVEKNNDTLRRKAAVAGAKSASDAPGVRAMADPYVVAH